MHNIFANTYIILDLYSIIRIFLYKYIIYNIHHQIKYVEFYFSVHKYVLIFDSACKLMYQHV